MKVIFLDFDGVLTTPLKWTLKSDKIKLLKKIVDHTGAKLVVSSSWRCGNPPNIKDTIDKMLGRPKRCSKNKLLNWFIDNLYDCTPLGRSWRGYEIKQYLDEHPDIENYVILDDDSDMLDEQLFHFVQTNYEDGLTEPDVEKAIKILNKKYISNLFGLNFVIRYEWLKKCDNLPNKYDEIIKYNDTCRDIKNI